MARTKVLTAHVPLAAWVHQQEERHRMTLEALDDVDAGRVIDHPTIQAWADSLGKDQPLPLPFS